MKTADKMYTTQILRLPHFLDNRFIDCGEVVSLGGWVLFGTPKKIIAYLKKYIWPNITKKYIISLFFCLFTHTSSVEWVIQCNFKFKSGWTVRSRKGVGKNRQENFIVSMEDLRTTKDVYGFQVYCSRFEPWNSWIGSRNVPRFSFWSRRLTENFIVWLEELRTARKFYGFQIYCSRF
jgi:hypothetical protein